MALHVEGAKGISTLNVVDHKVFWRLFQTVRTQEDYFE